MKIDLGSTLCGDGFKPLMIAEEGQANQGDMALAHRMIEVAQGSGADGIEFQLFLAKDMYIKCDPGYAAYQRKELDNVQIQELISAAKRHNLLFQAACLSPRLVDLCADAGVDSFCINATDINNPYILDAVAATGLPFWLATLMATTEEIDWAVEYLSRRAKANFGILHGQHVMSSDHSAGVPPELLQLDCIPIFAKRYGRVIGFVDHTDSIYVAALAVAKGASIIMKHLAPEFGWKGPDWQVCLAPHEWKQCRELVAMAGLSAGGSKELSIGEIKDRNLHRRGLYTSRPVADGEILHREDLCALRPGSGAEDPRNLDNYIGVSAAKQMSLEHPIQKTDVVLLDRKDR